MSGKKRPTYLIPILLLAVYPILFLYAQNIRSVRISDTLQSLLHAVLFGLLLLLLARPIFKSWDRAALFASICCLLFLAFGLLLQPFTDLLIDSPLPQQSITYLFIALWLLVLIFTFWGIKRLKNPTYAVKVLSIVALALVCFSLFNIALFHWQNRGSVETASAQLGTDLDLTTDQPVDLPALPDIYYVILDGYGRTDMLQSVYGYDNSAFIHELEEMGFYVADESKANYNRTILSLASAMNMSYLDEYAEAEGRESTRYALFDNLISGSQIIHFLEGIGYETVVISSGYQSTEFNKENGYRNSRASFIGEFERLVLQQTPFSLVPSFDQLLSYEAHRNRVLFALEELSKLAQERAAPPRFVFAHIISPHPPFVFGPNGEKINPDYPYYLGDAKDYQGSQADYLTGYANQLHYLNQVLRQTLLETIASSEVPPIIILQGDHGPGAYADFASVENSCLYERTSILNAYYLPGEHQEQLYASITPVNSFRVILDTYFGTNLGVLPDKVYFGEMPYLLDTIDISDSIDKTDCRKE